MGKALPDGVFLHAGQPQAGEGLFAVRLLVHQTENQFSLTPGIATVHDAIHIRAVHQLLQDAKLLFEKTVFKTFCGEKDDKYVKTPRKSAVFSHIYQFFRCKKLENEIFQRHDLRARAVRVGAEH